MEKYLIAKKVLSLELTRLSIISEENVHTNKVSLYFQVRLLTDFNKRGGKIDSMSHVPRAASDS